MTEKILGGLTQISVLKGSAVSHVKPKHIDYRLIHVLAMLLDLEDEGGSLTHVWWESVTHS